MSCNVWADLITQNRKVHLKSSNWGFAKQSYTWPMRHAVVERCGLCWDWTCFETSTWSRVSSPQEKQPLRLGNEPAAFLHSSAGPSPPSSRGESESHPLKMQPHGCWQQTRAYTAFAENFVSVMYLRQSQQNDGVENHKWVKYLFNILARPCCTYFCHTMIKQSENMLSWDGKM